MKRHAYSVCWALLLAVILITGGRAEALRLCCEPLMVEVQEAPCPEHADPKPTQKTHKSCMDSCVYCTKSMNGKSVDAAFMPMLPPKYSLAYVTAFLPFAPQVLERPPKMIG